MSTEEYNNLNIRWFAIKTTQDFTAEAYFSDKCEEVFFPKEYIVDQEKRTRVKAVIPHVLFLKTTADNIRELELMGRKCPERYLSFWIYRYPNDHEIQTIPQRSIDLMKLLTSDNTTRCRIYTGRNFKENERVRVTGGIYEGYEGYVQRVQRNKHVLVKIAGVCMVILPFIHPDLLQPLEDDGSAK